ncbi:MAG: alpha/beta fold hydrolase [Acidimicrobiales bacterium]
MQRPWLPPAQVIDLPGRGEMVCRVHAEGAGPWVVLLHGWTASGDLQWFTAYEALASTHRFVAVDHRGHGRGVRDLHPFRLEDAADDVAGVMRVLGLGPSIVTGYSMGGPISLLVARRHPELVSGLVLAATSLEFSSHRHQRLGWIGLPLLETMLRSRLGARLGQRGLRRVLADELGGYLPWLAAEGRRHDPRALREAGRAISGFDGRPWVGSLGVPAVSVVTTRDRLVPPGRQRELAGMIGAAVVELDGDHLVPWESPAAFSRALVRAVGAVPVR